MVKLRIARDDFSNGRIESMRDEASMNDPLLKIALDRVDRMLLTLHDHFVEGGCVYVTDKLANDALEDFSKSNANTVNYRVLRDAWRATLLSDVAQNLALRGFIVAQGLACRNNTVLIALDKSLEDSAVEVCHTR